MLCLEALCYFKIVVFGISYIYIYIMFVKSLLYIYIEIACDYKFCVFLVQHMYGYNNSCFLMNFQKIKQCCLEVFCTFNIYLGQFENLRHLNV